jgi:hypothetical protein
VSAASGVPWGRRLELVTGDFESYLTTSGDARTAIRDPRKTEDVMHEVLIVPCTVLKAWRYDPGLGPLPAKKAYRYPPFASWRGYAEASGLPWLIFSTKYGLIDPETEIEDYDRSASEARRDDDFREDVQDQARGHRLEQVRSLGVVGGENAAMAGLLGHVLPDLAERIRLVTVPTRR